MNPDDDDDDDDADDDDDDDTPDVLPRCRPLRGPRRRPKTYMFSQSLENIHVHIALRGSSSFPNMFSDNTWNMTCIT